MMSWGAPRFSTVRCPLCHEPFSKRSLPFHYKVRVRTAPITPHGMLPPPTTSCHPTTRTPPQICKRTHLTAHQLCKEASRTSRASASRSPSPTAFPVADAAAAEGQSYGQGYGQGAGAGPGPGLELYIEDVDTDAGARGEGEGRGPTLSTPPSPLVLSVSPVRQPTRCCNQCGRTFAPDRMEKHNMICRKVTARPVVVFNSHRQRWSSCLSDAKTVSRRLAAERPASRDSRGSPTRCMHGKWRSRHRELIRTVRRAKKEAYHR